MELTDYRKRAAQSLQRMMGNREMTFERLTAADVKVEPVGSLNLVRVSRIDGSEIVQGRRGSMKFKTNVLVSYVDGAWTIVE